MLQDVPSTDVAPAYLAAQPDGGAVLTAISQARTARLAMEDGAKPTQHQVVPLTGLSACAGLQGLEKIRCLEATFSADGRFLAVSFEAYMPRSKLMSESSHAFSWEEALRSPFQHGVAVLRAADGYREQTCICTHSVPPVLQWAPDAPHLSIAYITQPCPVFQQQSAVLMLDAETGTAVHALGPETESMFRRGCSLGQGVSNRLQWSRSGALLLVSNILTHEELEEGVLAVFDVRRDVLVAHSAYSAEPPGMHTGRLTASWHPSGQGLMVPQRVKLWDPQAFSGELAVVVLPESSVLGSDAMGTWILPDGR